MEPHFHKHSLLTSYLYKTNYNKQKVSTLMWYSNRPRELVVLFGALPRHDSVFRG